MCTRSLAARGVRVVRPSPRENKASLVAQRDEDEVAKKKAVRRVKARHPAKKAKRARRRRAKMEKEGARILRRLGFM